MCGITGFFNIKEADKKMRAALKLITYRGEDAIKYDDEKQGSIGHCLLALHRNVPQPFKNEKFSFVTNCEIYNWKELDEKNNTNSKNDAHALFQHLSNHNDLHEALKDLDGVYAFCLWNKKIDHLFLARDILGIKPLWYYFEPVKGEFAFASEKKSLKYQGLEEAFIKELNPRKILMYNLKTKELKEYEREFFSIKETKDSKEEIFKKTEAFLLDSIKKRIPKGRKAGLLFYGGIDSTFIAMNLKKLGVDFECYVAALKHDEFKESQDLMYAKKVAKELDLKLNIVEIELNEVPKYLKIILPLIEDNNVVKAGVALPFFLCAEKAKEDNVKILFSGLGSEEIFAGYERHKKSNNINEECLSGLRKMYERDLYRDDTVTMYHTIELRLPFLDKKLVKYALTIPDKYKLDKERNKIILREIAKKEGLNEEFAERRKKAAQYGSNFDKAIKKLAKKENKNKSAYLKKFYDFGNVRLGVLLSTGKDSLLATQIMLEQNYDVACFITIESDNKDSYMYHGPNTHLAELQAKATGKPLLMKKTKGEKEEELLELKEAISEAVKKYKIEGIVTGALFSNYQRKRIEKICDEIGIKCFSPLWHMNQENEVKLLIDKGFKFTIIKIAAEGLSVSWLGEIITEKHLERLKQLYKKIGFNVAGEGGEYESLVLDAPFFDKEIVIKKSRIEQESEISATLIVEEAFLQEKTSQ